MKLFILYQTDVWRYKASRVFFGIFDSRIKAIPSAKYNGLYCSCAEVVIEEVILNLFEDNLSKKAQFIYGLGFLIHPVKVTNQLKT